MGETKRYLRTSLVYKNVTRIASLISAPLMTGQHTANGGPRVCESLHYHKCSKADPAIPEKVGVKVNDEG